MQGGLASQDRIDRQAGSRAWTAHPRWRWEHDRDTLMEDLTPTIAARERLGMSAAEISRIARQFGAPGRPERLPGGQGQSWKVGTDSGAIVVKPAPHPDEAQWTGPILSEAIFAPDVRVPRPIATGKGEWIEQDHVAWTWLDGGAMSGRYIQKIAAARAFHIGLRSLCRPNFMDRRNDPWAMADRVAWGEAPADYDAGSMAALAPVLEMIADTPLPRDCKEQVVHGDLSGNYVFADGHAPGIIDITPYWRPEGFAEAVIWVDAIWFSESAQPEHFDQVGMRAYVLRALARRIAEQPEQVKAGMKSADEASRFVNTLRNATFKLLEPWASG